MTIINQGEHIQFPYGVDSKYASTSNLGMILSDTPEQVEYEREAAEHTRRIAVKASLNHAAALADISSMTNAMESSMMREPIQSSELSQPEREAISSAAHLAFSFVTSEIPNIVQQLTSATYTS